MVCLNIFSLPGEVAVVAKLSCFRCLSSTAADIFRRQQPTVEKSTSVILSLLNMSTAVADEMSSNIVISRAQPLIPKHENLMNMDTGCESLHQYSSGNLESSFFSECV